MIIHKLSELVQKVNAFCHVVKSVKYKSLSDEIVLHRVYQGDETVGYSYNEQHSFEDFKKAMMM